MKRIVSIIIGIIGLAVLFLAGIYLKYNILNHFNHGAGPASWFLTAKIFTVAFLLFFAAFWLWNSFETIAKRAMRLKNSGNFVMAKYVRTRNLMQEGLAVPEVNGIAGVVVEAHYSVTNSKISQSFFSPTVWDLPTPMPQEIKVYVNPKDLSDYHMDIGLTLPEVLQKHRA